MSVAMMFTNIAVSKIPLVAANGLSIQPTRFEIRDIAGADINTLVGGVLAGKTRIAPAVGSTAIYSSPISSYTPTANGNINLFLTVPTGVVVAGKTTTSPLGYQTNLIAEILVFGLDTSITPNQEFLMMVGQPVDINGVQSTITSDVTTETTFQVNLSIQNQPNKTTSDIINITQTQAMVVSDHEKSTNFHPSVHYNMVRAPLPSDDLMTLDATGKAISQGSTWYFGDHKYTCTNAITGGAVWTRIATPSNSAEVALPSSTNTVDYITPLLLQQKIDYLVNGAPAAFNTLIELSNALGSNTNAASLLANRVTLTESKNVAQDLALNTHELDNLNPHSVTKAQVGLGSVNNTSDVNKPVSTAQQSALNGKENVSVGGGISFPQHGLAGVGGTAITLPVDTALDALSVTYPSGLYEVNLTVAQLGLPVGLWYLDYKRHSSDTTATRYYSIMAHPLDIQSSTEIYRLFMVNSVVYGFARVDATAQARADAAYNLANSNVGAIRSWIDLLANRSYGVLYTNTLTHEIVVSAHGMASASGSNISLIVGGLTVDLYQHELTGASDAGSVTGVVPPNTVYSIVSVGYSKVGWVELR